MANALPLLLLAAAAVFAVSKGKGDEGEGSGEGDDDLGGDGDETDETDSTDETGLGSGEAGQKEGCDGDAAYAVEVTIGQQSPAHGHPPTQGDFTLTPSEVAAEGAEGIEWHLGATTVPDWQGHRHTIDLTADQVAELMSKGTVSTTSGSGWMTGPEQATGGERLPHTHVVTLTCHMIGGDSGGTGTRDIAPSGGLAIR